MLSLPMFAFMPRSVQRGFVGLGRPTKSLWPGSAGVTSSKGMSVHPYAILAFNLVSQLICVSGVNQLSSVRFTIFDFSTLHTGAPFPHLLAITFPLPHDYPRTCLRCSRSVPSK